MIDEIISIVADIADFFINLWIDKIFRRKKEDEEKSKLSKAIEISYEGTVFSYDGNDYEITEREKLVYSIRGYERIGKHILVVGNVGKNAEYYGIFNTEIQEFETDIIASRITYRDDDIYSLVYCIDNKLYDYCGNAIGGYELLDSEYIYDIYFENEGKELVIEIGILNSDEKPRIVNVIYKNTQCNGK